MPLPALGGLEANEIAYSVAFSPDGKTLAAAGEHQDSTGSLAAWVRQWDVASGALVRSLPAACGQYADSLAFSHDGQRLATGCYNGTVEIWQVADGSRLVEMASPNSVHNLHFSPDDSLLIVATVDGTARIWDPATGTMLTDTIRVAAEMADADFSPDGKQIASTFQTSTAATGNNQVWIWDATTGGMVQSLSGHDQYISKVVWIDQNRLVSDDWSGRVILWARDASGAFSMAKTWSTGGQAMGIGVSPDKTTIAVGGTATNGQGDGFVFLTL